ncbi:hypothetical protein A2U01_0065748, partial [Trifolium medium]|nr:hypothetical protein [Trifolium medium]
PHAQGQAQPQAQGHLMAQAVAVSEPHPTDPATPRLFQCFCFFPPYRCRSALSSRT